MYNCQKISINKPITITSGVFDLIHPGHVNHFAECKYSLWPGREASVIVLLNSDESLELLERKYKPVLSDIERRDVLEAIIHINDVAFFHESNPCEHLKSLVQDLRTQGHKDILYAKGGDYINKTIPEEETCAELGIDLIFTHQNTDSLGNKYSSSILYNRIKERILKELD